MFLQVSVILLTGGEQRGCLLPGGVCFGGCLLPRGCLLLGVPAPRGGSAPGGVCPWGGLVETPRGWLLLRAVRTLLECILVLVYRLFNVTILVQDKI